jgi:hypothetical protein
MHGGVISFGENNRRFIFRGGIPPWSLQTTPNISQAEGSASSRNLQQQKQ